MDLKVRICNTSEQDPFNLSPPWPLPISVCVDSKFPSPECGPPYRVAWFHPPFDPGECITSPVLSARKLLAVYAGPGQCTEYTCRYVVEITDTDGNLLQRCELRGGPVPSWECVYNVPSEYQVPDTSVFDATATVELYANYLVTVSGQTVFVGYSGKWPRPVTPYLWREKKLPAALDVVCSSSRTCIWYYAPDDFVQDYIAALEDGVTSLLEIAVDVKKMPEVKEADFIVEGVGIPSAKRRLFLTVTSNPNPMLRTMVSLKPPFRAKTDVVPMEGLLPDLPKENVLVSMTTSDGKYLSFRIPLNFDVPKVQVSGGSSLSEEGYMELCKFYLDGKYVGDMPCNIWQFGKTSPGGPVKFYWVNAHGPGSVRCEGGVCNATSRDVDPEAVEAYFSGDWLYVPANILDDIRLGRDRRPEVKVVLKSDLDVPGALYFVYVPIRTKKGVLWGCGKAEKTPEGFVANVKIQCRPPLSLRVNTYHTANPSTATVAVLKAFKADISVCKKYEPALDDTIYCEKQDGSIASLVPEKVAERVVRLRGGVVRGTEVLKGPCMVISKAGDVVTFSVRSDRERQIDVYGALFLNGKQVTDWVKLASVRRDTAHFKLVMQREPPDELVTLRLRVVVGDKTEEFPIYISRKASCPS